MRYLAFVFVLVGTGLSAQAQGLNHQQIVAKAWEIANERSGYYDELGAHVRGPIAQGTIDQLVRELAAENAAANLPRETKSRRHRGH